MQRDVVFRHLAKRGIALLERGQSPKSHAHSCVWFFCEWLHALFFQASFEMYQPSWDFVDGQEQCVAQFHKHVCVTGMQHCVATLHCICIQQHCTAVLRRIEWLQHGIATWHHSIALQHRLTSLQHHLSLTCAALQHLHCHAVALKTMSQAGHWCPTCEWGIAVQSGIAALHCIIVALHW